MYGNQCFEKSMKNSTIENLCDCPLECNSISYSFNFVSTPFVPEEMCPSKLGENDFLMREFYVNRYPSQFVRKLYQFKDNVTSDVSEVCSKKIQYRAEIIFRLETESISVTVMKRRLSFFEKMSAFGNQIKFLLLIYILS